MAAKRLRSLREHADWIPQDIARVLEARSGKAMEPIRAELFGPERFEQHGRSLGASHRARKVTFTQATFYPRLQDNIRTLRVAHRYIALQATEGHEIGAAAEWLLDNFHLIEDQLREIREGLPARYYRSLPVLQDPPLVGLPRVYGVAWAFIAHTDSAFSETLLLHFLNAYQSVCELNQGELWALPTTLRVVLVENLRRLADRVASYKAARELATLCATQLDTLTLPAVQSLRHHMDKRGVGLVFLAQLMQHLAAHGPASKSTTLPLVKQWLEQEVPDLGALHAQQHIDQAADHLSMGNAFTALRAIGAASWSDIVTQTSCVMRVMLGSGVFAAEDEATRNKTLHAVERLAATSRLSESEVARRLLDAMVKSEGHTGLAGYWLEGDGRTELEHLLGIRHLLPRAWREQARVTRTHAYFGTLVFATLLVVLALTGSLSAGAQTSQNGWGHHAAALLTLLLVLLPASEAVVALVNRLISEATKPTHLSRLLLADGVPAYAQTMVVVPAMLSHRQGIDTLVHRLLLHHLGNQEAHTQFALLSDWGDATTAHEDGDEALLAHAQQALHTLNTQYPAPPGQPPRFLLLHRQRTYSTTQDRWMGWERKRGKLEQLVAALATDSPGPFIDLGELSRMAPGTRYLITLDSDTELPPGRLRALVGVAEHPQNQPALDPSGRRVTRGYGILQPRVVAPLPVDTATTPWQWLFAGQRGMDPYSAMSSDVYQDVFDEGSFTGKGLLHVATLHAVLGSRLPAEQILSHDLLEGALARCAVVTDVTLIEADPLHADAAAARLHRWTRGDWQLLPFVLRRIRWPLGAINRWKLFDNLRRSLVAPACLALIVLSMAGHGLPLAAALALTGAAFAGGPLLGALASAFPAHWRLAGPRFLHAALMDVLRALAGGLWHVSMLLQTAAWASDAVLRTLYRLLVSRRQLLAWTTADVAQARLRPGLPATLWRHWREPVAASALLALLSIDGSPPAAPAVVLLLIWTGAPLLVWLCNTAWVVPRQPALTPADTALLQGVARDSWRLFERCVDADNHHLPPDNLQLSPFEVVAHRTSPTNIGLYLLSTACARQFGWIGTEELLSRIEGTLHTLEQLERHQGHFLNWYDTQTLHPLFPRYVSTVDSGNLSAHLLAVAQACRELAREPHSRHAHENALRQSHIRLQPRQTLIRSLLPDPVQQALLNHLLASEPPEPGDTTALATWQTMLTTTCRALAELAPQAEASFVTRYPAKERAPVLWLLGDHLATLRSIGLDRLAEGPTGTPLAAQRLTDLAQALENLAWAPNFQFLYHPKRHLLHIGYRLEDQTLDSAYYDLLASESHVTSFVAMAKDDVPVRHWTALARPFFASGKHAVLRSWSGSMFEYLMPALVMTSPRGSALHEADRSALREQMAFGRHQGLPWGVSESAYAGRDQGLAYQYAPQGVPRLALRRNPLYERVVAPYATALAAMVDARQACRNFRRLEAHAARGQYGFIEALDFTHNRQTHGGGFTLVNTYMAHHQGMSIVALANVLLHGPAQRWGMAHPRIEAMGSLLHERAPRELPAPTQPPTVALKALQHRTAPPVRVLVPDALALAPTHLMSNGHYNVTLRPNGAGWSRLGQTGINRWRDDSLRDACGSFIYLRRYTDGSPVIQGAHVSITSHPAPDPQASYQSSFLVDRVCFEATWADLRALTTVWVSPEDDIELRKVVLFNLSDKPIEVELTAALDVTLVSHANDEAHPAFSGLFVQAEWRAPQRALRFERTPRLQTENAVRAALFLADIQGEALSLVAQTDRQQWQGRNRPHSHPLGAMHALPAESCALRTGLDPVAALGAVLRLPPGGQACVTFATAASHDEAALTAVIDKYQQPSYVERSSAMSATFAGIQTLPHRLHTEYLPAQQALTSALLMLLPKANATVAGKNTHHEAPGGHSDRRLLWPLGLSGERPLLLVHAGPVQGLALLRIMALLLREWSRASIGCDLVVLSSEVYAHHMPLQQAFMQMCNQHQAETASHRDPPVTGFHMFHRDSVTPAQIETLSRLARVQLHADGRPFLHQIKAWTERHEALVADQLRASSSEPIPVRMQLTSTTRTAPPSGQFDNETGAFTFEVGQGQRPPRPWINVLANPGMGTLVTESGAGHTWAVNSHMNQLTAWSNDPVSDPSAEWFLLQDRRTREIWSMTPSAWGDDSTPSRVVHTQGLTTISQQHGAVFMSLSWCVDPDTSIKQVRVRLLNKGQRKAHLRIVGMVEWILGSKRSDRATLHTTPIFEPPQRGELLALLCTQTEATSGMDNGTSFLCEGHPGTDTPGHDRTAEGLDWTCNRQAFFDAQGRLALPRRLGQHAGSGLDPCAAMARLVTLRPGASVEQVFLIGYAANPEAAVQLARQAITRSAAERESAAKSRWNALLRASRVHTPDPLLDALVNHWLLYQTVSSRLWAKAAFYQAGGATGYRDQLQDTMALAWAAPAMLREQIVLCASRQFESGDVQHWWHAPSGAGVRTHFSDDLLWLPYACAHYLRTTGDAAVLDESVPFLEGTVIAPDAEDAYDTPRTSTLSVSVYEHAARAIDHSLRVGSHGLPLMGSGDWNDGMNRVGHEGRGESVWLAWFLCAIVQHWAPLARQRDEPERATRWETSRSGWQKALQGPAWDGQWYLRAFFDDGSPLGTHTQPEAQIDLIAQAWAVLSHEAPLMRQHQAMDAVQTHLMDQDHGLLRLLTPAFARANPSPGYIQAYPPGVRENGGQYTHAGVWALMAAAALAQHAPGERYANDLPYLYFTCLSPAHRASHPQWGKAYGLEPYAVAADVYSEPPYAGRGGWSWYTGAAGWMHRAVLESIIGLHLDAQELFFTPCIPSHWPQAELTLERAGRRMRFVLFRGSAAQALEACGDSTAQTLQPAERLRWPELPANSCFAIALPPLS